MNSSNRTDKINGKNNANEVREKKKNIIYIFSALILFVAAVVFILFLTNNFNSKHAHNKSDQNTTVSSPSLTPEAPQGPTEDSSSSETTPSETTTGDTPDEPSDNEDKKSDNSSREPKALPGENRAEIKNPKAKTVYEKFSPNVTREGSIAVPYWGNAFYPPVDRGSNQLPYNKDAYVKPDKNFEEIILHRDKQNHEVDKFLNSAVPEILTFRTRNYATTDCAVAGAKTLITKNVFNEYMSKCKKDHNPMGIWVDLMRRDAKVRVKSMQLIAQGSAYVFHDTDTTGSRSYVVKAELYDDKGVIKNVRFWVNADVKKINGDWRINEFSAPII